MVFGRYLTVFLPGFAALLFIMAIQLLILNTKNAVPAACEIFMALVICMVLFCIYGSVQIPGYYRFGAIKGKLFMFIPTIGFLLLHSMMKITVKRPDGFNPALFHNYPVLFCGAAILMAAMTFLSVSVSVRIVYNQR